MGDQHLKEQPVASSTTPKAVRTVGTALIVCATMKTLVTLTLVLLSSQHTGRAGDFINPESSPRLTIKSVYRNRSEPDLLSVVVQFSATKEGPVALTQDQVSIHITTADKPHLFVSDATFQKKAPKKLLIKPGSPVTYTLQVGKNRFGKKGSWKSLPPRRVSPSSVRQLREAARIRLPLARSDLLGRVEASVANQAEQIAEVTTGSPCSAIRRHIPVRSPAMFKQDLTVF